MKINMKGTLGFNAEFYEKKIVDFRIVLINIIEHDIHLAYRQNGVEDDSSRGIDLRKPYVSVSPDDYENTITYCSLYKNNVGFVVGYGEEELLPYTSLTLELLIKIIRSLENEYEFEKFQLTEYTEKELLGQEA